MLQWGWLAITDSATLGENQNTVYESKHLIPTVKLGGRKEIILSDFAATEPGHLGVKT